MTAPTTPPPPAVTIPFTVPTGGQGVRLTDGAGNTPAGLTLVNRGDNGGTVWVSSGPANTGAAVPLGPGGTMQWTDPAVFPYASLSSAATKTETLVVSSQATGYSNPSTVAAALVQQGIPSTFLSTGYGTWRLGVSLSSSPMNVGQSASLTVSVYWPQPTPVGNNVLRLAFTDPAVPELPAQYYFLTAENGASPGEQFTWQVPVLGPVLTITNMSTPDNNNADGYVQVTGSNRTVPKLRQVGQEIGISRLAATNINNGAVVVLQPYSDGFFGASVFTRMTGLVTIQTEGTAQAGVLEPNWIDQTGRRNHLSISTNGSNQAFQWAHPAVPVVWRFANVSGTNGQAVYVTISQAN